MPSSPLKFQQIPLLLGSFNPSEIYEFVSWDHEIPNIWNIKVMFQTTNQIKYTNPTNSSSHFYRRSWLLAISAAFGASGGFALQSSSGSSKAKSRPASCDRLGMGSPWERLEIYSLDWLAGWIESSTSLWIPMRFAYVSYVNGHRKNPECPDFHRAHEATPTIQLLTITYVRTLPAAQNTEKNNPRLGREKLMETLMIKPPSFWMIQPCQNM